MAIEPHTTEYSNIHKWVAANFGTPDTCEDCGRTGLSSYFIQWANISGDYRKERSDWRRLCASCHKLFDSGGNRFVCKRGHPRDKANTYTNPTTGYRRCQTCIRAR